MKTTTDAIQEYAGMQKEFNEKYENDTNFKLKVIVCRILLLKIFLSSGFERFYGYFIKNWEINYDKVKEVFPDLDLKLSGETFEVRHDSLWKIEWIENLLDQNSWEVLQSLRNSIELYIKSISWDFKGISDDDEKTFKSYLESLLYFQYEELKRVSWIIFSQENVDNFVKRVAWIIQAQNKNLK